MSSKYLVEKGDYLKRTLQILETSLFTSPPDILVLRGGDIDGCISIEEKNNEIRVYKHPKKISTTGKKLIFKSPNDTSKSILFIGCKWCDINVDVKLFKLLFLKCNNLNIKVKKGCIHSCEFDKVYDTTLKLEKKTDIVHMIQSKKIKVFQLTDNVNYATYGCVDANVNTFPDKNKKTFSIVPEDCCNSIYYLSCISEKEGLTDTLFSTNLTNIA